MKRLKFSFSQVRNNIAINLDLLQIIYEFTTTSSARLMYSHNLQSLIYQKKACS